MKKIIIGIVSIVIGVIGTIVYLNTGLVFIGVLFIGVPAGIALLWNALKNNPISFMGFGSIKNMTFSQKAEKSKNMEMKENSIVLRPNKLCFEYVKDPPGYPYKLKNTGQKINLLIEGKNGKLEEYVIPDVSEYYDPAEFANVISMPAHKRLFERQQTMFEKLSPAFLLGGMIIVGIIFALV